MISSSFKWYAHFMVSIHLPNPTCGRFRLKMSRELFLRRRKQSERHALSFAFYAYLWTWEISLSKILLLHILHFLFMLPSTKTNRCSFTFTLNDGHSRLCWYRNSFTFISPLTNTHSRLYPRLLILTRLLAFTGSYSHLLTLTPVYNYVYSHSQVHIDVC